jgi:hypothetical protein
MRLRGPRQDRGKPEVASLDAWVKERYCDSGAQEKSGCEVVDRKTSHTYGTMALTGKGDLEVDEEEARPAFRLEACKKEGREKGGTCKGFLALNEAGAHVFMQFGRQVC